MPIRLQGLLNNHKMLVENKATYSQMIENMPWELLAQGYIGADAEEIGEIKAEIVSQMWAHVNLAKDAWQRSDRVIWWIKVVKVWALMRFNLDDDTPKKVKFYKELLRADTLWGRFSAQAESIGLIFDTMSHFFSLQYAPIQNFQLASKSPMAVVAHLRQLEHDYIRLNAENERLIAPEPSETIIKEFPDGFAWVNLNRAACSKEGAALGHCGNSPRSDTNDRIISLRKKHNGKWKAALTFVLEEDGYFGERKGAGNLPPTEKYHPYVVGLLSMSFYKGMKEGHWMHNRDFQISHLSPEWARELYQHRPDLFTVVDNLRMDPGAPIPLAMFSSQKLEGLLSEDASTVEAYLAGDAANNAQKKREIEFRERVLRASIRAHYRTDGSSLNPGVIYTLYSTSTILPFPLTRTSLALENLETNYSVLSMGEKMLLLGPDDPRTRKDVPDQSLQHIIALFTNSANISPLEKPLKEKIPRYVNDLVKWVLSNPNKSVVTGNLKSLHGFQQEFIEAAIRDTFPLIMSEMNDYALINTFEEHPEFQKLMFMYYDYKPENAKLGWESALKIYEMETFISYIRGIRDAEDGVSLIEGIDLGSIIQKFGKDETLLKVLQQSGVIPAHIWLRLGLVDQIGAERILKARANSVSIPEILEIYKDSPEIVDDLLTSFFERMGFHIEDDGDDGQIYVYDYGEFERAVRYEADNGVPRGNIEYLFNLLEEEDNSVDSDWYEQQLLEVIPDWLYQRGMSEFKTEYENDYEDDEEPQREDVIGYIASNDRLMHDVYNLFREYYLNIARKKADQLLNHMEVDFASVCEGANDCGIGVVPFRFRYRNALAMQAYLYQADAIEHFSKLTNGVKTLTDWEQDLVYIMVNGLDLKGMDEFVGDLIDDHLGGFLSRLKTLHT